MSLSSKLERRFAADLRANGIYFEANCRDLPGTPDIVFRQIRLVLFVHGCFWHSHQGCQLANVPKKMVSRWLSSLNSTVIRDTDARIRLQTGGWSVVVFWECELQQTPNDCIKRAVDAIENQQIPVDPSEPTQLV